MGRPRWSVHARLPERPLTRRFARIFAGEIRYDARRRPCVTLREAARRMGVSARGLLGKVRDGTVPGEKTVDGFLLIPLDALGVWTPDPAKQAAMRRITLGAAARRRARTQAP